MFPFFFSSSLSLREDAPSLLSARRAGRIPFFLSPKRRFTPLLRGMLSCIYYYRRKNFPPAKVLLPPSPDRFFDHYGKMISLVSFSLFLFGIEGAFPLVLGFSPLFLPRQIRRVFFPPVCEMVRALDARRRRFPSFPILEKGVITLPLRGR